jgi:hypothetical protein
MPVHRPVIPSSIKRKKLSGESTLVRPVHTLRQDATVRSAAQAPTMRDACTPSEGQRLSPAVSAIGARPDVPLKKLGDRF